MLTGSLLQIVELAPVIFLERKEQTLADSKLWLRANKERLYYLFTLFRYRHRQNTIFLFFFKPVHLISSVSVTFGSLSF